MNKTIKTIAMLALVVGSTKAIAQNTAINSTGTAPDASAMLDVSSTTKGLLTPRMTSAQRTAIVSPATGLIVYQTDFTDGFYYYDGSSWILLINNVDALPAVSGAAVTSLNASNLSSGTVGTARLGSGSATSSTYLRGDGTWNTPSGSSGTLTESTANSVSVALTTTVADVSTFTLASKAVVTITITCGTNTATGKFIYVTDNSNNLYAMSSNGSSSTAGLMANSSLTAVLPAGSYKIRMAANAAGSTVTSYDLRKIEF